MIIVSSNHYLIRRHLLLSQQLYIDSDTWCVHYNMATFHPFPRLPKELRLQIWEATVEPRVVHTECKYCSPARYYGRAPRRLMGLSSSTPIPGPLQTCREARNARLYQRVFSELPELPEPKKTKKTTGKATSTSFVEISEPPPKPYAPVYEQRYFWINLDIDTVDIGETYFSFFEPVAHLIKRLRFTRDVTEEYWYHTESRELRIFTNLIEIQVAVESSDFMVRWHGASIEYFWPCGEENVVVVELEKGTSMKLMDVEYKYDRMQEEAYRLQGWRTRLHCGEIVSDSEQE
jgi:hypothetical protein